MLKNKTTDITIPSEKSNQIILKLIPKIKVSSNLWLLSSLSSKNYINVILVIPVLHK